MAHSQPPEKDHDLCYCLTQYEDTRGLASWKDAGDLGSWILLAKAISDGPQPADLKHMGDYCKGLHTVPAADQKHMKERSRDCKYPSAIL